MHPPNRYPIAALIFCPTMDPRLRGDDGLDGNAKGLTRP